MNGSEILTIEDVLRIEYLEKIFNRIRKNRDVIIRDPLEYMAYEIRLRDNLKTLNYKVINGEHRPAILTFIKAAKRDGMTRKQAYPELEDQIILKAITDSLEPQLLADFPEYVNYSRSNIRVSDTDDEVTYETWIETWLRHQDLLKKFVAQESPFNYLVEADVSNFFPSINLRALRHAVATASNADEKLLNLLFYILGAIMERPDYATDHESGLPQENHDASRILAHFFLKSVDDAFKKEGDEGRYVRWVDDFRIAVETESEGRKTLARLQETLEKRGLFLNAAKSKIQPHERARKNLFFEENAYIQSIQDRKEEGEPVDIDDFNTQLATFLASEEENQSGSWNRVLRRYYTVARRVESDGLEEHFYDHLYKYPGSAGHIVKYLAGRPHTPHLLEMLHSYLKSPNNLYQNVEILLYELLLTWRCAPDDRFQFAKAGIDHLFGRNGWPFMQHEYGKGLVALLLLKYGTREEMKELAGYFDHSNEKHFIRYAYIVLRATGEFESRAARKILYSDDLELRRIAALLDELTQHPEQYRTSLKRRMNPLRFKWPDRYELRARSIPLFQLTKTGDFRDKGWNDLANQAIKRLKDTPKQYQDKVSIQWLEAEKIGREGLGSSLTHQVS